MFLQRIDGTHELNVGVNLQLICLSTSASIPLIQSDNNGQITDYGYDVFGRRLFKNSQNATNSTNGSLTLFGWDGDLMIWESQRSNHKQSNQQDYTKHYVYEPNSFVPLFQTGYVGFIKLIETPDYSQFQNEPYSIYKDPVWSTETRKKRAELERVAFYHCDQVGTPQTLSNELGQCVWEIKQDTWGATQEIKSANEFNLLEQSNIRFQGQYYDSETGLHYNRYRYYEPFSARYVSKDPIGLFGGLHSTKYVSDPNQWIDPMGLMADYAWTDGNGSFSRTKDSKHKYPADSITAAKNVQMDRQALIDAENRQRMIQIQNESKKTQEAWNASAQSMNEINKQQSRGYGSESALIPQKVDTPWVPPSLPDWVVDGAAGWGDTVSFGATSKVRDWMGTNDVVNKDSLGYKGGQGVGLVNAGLLGRAAIFKAGGATNLLNGTGASLRTFLAGNSIPLSGALGVGLPTLTESFKCKCVQIPELNTNKIMFDTTLSASFGALYKAPMLEGAFLTRLGTTNVRKVADEAIDASLEIGEKIVISGSAIAAGFGVSQASKATLFKEEGEKKNNYGNNTNFIFNFF